VFELVSRTTPEKAERARIDANKAAAAIKKQRGKQSKHRRPYKPRQGRVIGPKLRLKRRLKSRLKSGRKHKPLKLQRTLHQKLQVPRSLKRFLFVKRR
jgi:hypothetical protein